MTSFPSVGVIIPAYCPGTALVNLVRDLDTMGFGLILVIDDGSPESYQLVFEELPNGSVVETFRHRANQGKGAALKTAFMRVLETHPEISHVITADADGQHQVEDIHRVAVESLQQDDALILGVREFHETVPARSRFGNLLTRWIFCIFSGKAVSDTQTGLRGIPVSELSNLLDLETNRYEYELEAMLTAIRSGTRISEVPIATIYLEGNASSHFRPVFDSLRIYFVFLRYSIISLISFVLDVLFFSILFFVTNGRIMVSTYGARLLSGSFNFLANRSFVFNAHRNGGFDRQAIGYILLAVGIATLSGLGVSGVVMISNIHPIIAKIFVDLFLFIMSFLTQRYVIFRNH